MDVVDNTPPNQNPSSRNTSQSNKMASESSQGGRYLQRLRQLEDDNQVLRQKVDELSEWKTRMEVWIYDQFEVRFDSNFGLDATDDRIDRTSPAPSDVSTLPNEMLYSFPSDSPKLTTPAKTKAGDRSELVVAKKSSPVDSTSTSSHTSASSMSGSFIPPKKRKTETEAHNACDKKDKTLTPARDGHGAAAEPSTSASAMFAKRSLPSNGSLETKPGPKSKKLNNGTSKKIDEEARCSVCDDKYAEENNDMLFCDKCNICVHQACYGVKDIPETEWYCKPCEKGLEETPKCMFCPNAGGAMVPVRSPSNKAWAHVFCAMWIPEVTFLNPEDIDLVVNVHKIDKHRWTMKCCLCKMGKNHGACIQCQWKKCTTAFHVTCASRNKLKMEGVLDDSLPGGVALMAYCERHRFMEGGN